jgi:hypothetical protein
MNKYKLITTMMLTIMAISLFSWSTVNAENKKTTIYNNICSERPEISIVSQNYEYYTVSITNKTGHPIFLKSVKIMFAGMDILNQIQYSNFAWKNGAPSGETFYINQEQPRKTAYIMTLTFSGSHYSVMAIDFCFTKPIKNTIYLPIIIK